MKVLVTGAAGFIGMHVCERLLCRGDEVIGVDSLNDYYDVSLKEARLLRLTPHAGFRLVRMDIADRKSMEELFAREKPQRVINLAAQAGVRYSLKNPHAYVDSNLVGFVCYTTMFSRTDDTKTAYIAHVYAPGHGAVMMQMLQDHLKSLGVSILLLEIPDHDRHQERILRAFYDRQGYKRGDSRYLSPQIKQFLESVKFRTEENLEITGKFLNGIEWKHLMAKAV